MLSPQGFGDPIHKTRLWWLLGKQGLCKHQVLHLKWIFWVANKDISRFQIQGVSFCILNSHLAAHTEFNEARIESYNKIMGEHLFSKASGTEMILYHDYVIWTGDLNFRLEDGVFSHSEARDSIAYWFPDHILKLDLFARS